MIGEISPFGFNPKGDPQCIYFKPDPDGELDSEIDTTPENELRIFKNLISMNKRVSEDDLDEMVSSFQRRDKSTQTQRLKRIYSQAVSDTRNSLKKYLNFGASTLITPKIEDKGEGYRIFISGLSGSGKSFWISNFMKHNKLISKEAGAFLFSPVKDDKSLSGIKNLIHLNLDELNATLEGKDFEIDDIPRHSAVLFDDVESFPKKQAKEYMEMRDIFLERSRHFAHRVFTISHNCLNGNATKVSIRESQYWVLFLANKADCTKILKIYGGLTQDQIRLITSQKSRYCLFKKTHPQYALFEHSIIVL